MLDLVISPLAKEDMQEIGDYISHELGNPVAAKHTIQRFHTAMMPLRQFPEMGSPLFAPGTQENSYRFLVSGNYLIFYHIGDTSVQIDRVLYGRRDYMILLFGSGITED